MDYQHKMLVSCIFLQLLDHKTLLSELSLKTGALFVGLHEKTNNKSNHIKKLHLHQIMLKLNLIEFLDVALFIKTNLLNVTQTT